MPKPVRVMTVGLLVESGKRLFRAMSFCRRRRKSQAKGYGRMFRLRFRRPRPRRPFAFGVRMLLKKTIPSVVDRCGCRTCFSGMDCHLAMERSLSADKHGAVDLNRNLCRRSARVPTVDCVGRMSRLGKLCEINAAVTEPRPSGSGFPKTVKHPASMARSWDHTDYARLD